MDLDAFTRSFTESNTFKVLSTLIKIQLGKVLRNKLAERTKGTLEPTRVQDGDFIWNMAKVKSPKVICVDNCLVESCCCYHNGSEKFQLFISSSRAVECFVETVSLWESRREPKWIKLLPRYTWEAARDTRLLDNSTE